jgi:C4-dicarboxylate-specific signal transduction histidine kinase
MDAMNSAVGHELNQPLAAITAYVAGLRRMLRRDSLDHATIEAILQIRLFL